MISTVAVHGYRSLREVVLPLGRVTVVTGANGSGKSSLYRALTLVSAAGQGHLVVQVAAAGGLPSVLWAGPEVISGAMRRGEVAVQGTGSRSAPVSLMLGFAADDFGYLVDVGLPLPSGSRFVQDPVIKREVVFSGPVMRPASTLVRRAKGRVEVRDGGWRPLEHTLGDRDSLLSELADPLALPELAAVRQRVRGWRCYDGFRVDAGAPARQPHAATWTPVLADDGADLAPALQTVLESAQADVLLAAFDRAFPGAGLHVVDVGTRMQVAVTQPGLLRPMEASELSDGTLRFLLLAVALCTPRPPSLMVLNEPEASLHPDLLPGLADLVAAAARRTQVLVVSHSPAIVEALHAEDAEDVVHHELERDLGETRVVGQGLLTKPQWDFGRR